MELMLFIISLILLGVGLHLLITMFSKLVQPKDAPVEPYDLIEEDLNKISSHQLNIGRRKTRHSEGVLFYDDSGSGLDVEGLEDLYYAASDLASDYGEDYHYDEDVSLNNQQQAQETLNETIVASEPEPLRQNVHTPTPTFETSTNDYSSSDSSWSSSDSSWSSSDSSGSSWD